MKRLLPLVFSSLLISANALALTVLIDPGHGGEDYGAIRSISGKKVFEKDLALKMSFKIKDELEKLGVSTFLTRSVDRTVGLHERAEMAEKVKADLFISVHFNSAHKEHSHGVETFYLDNHIDKAVQKIEEIENKDLSGSNLVINQILVDLVVQNTAPLSKKLADNIHSEVKRRVVKRFRLKDRGMKPGLFYVLALSKVPAVLLEVGFMSNPKELEKLTLPAFQSKYARSIAIGIKNYIGKSKEQKTAQLF